MSRTYSVQYGVNKQKDNWLSYSRVRENIRFVLLHKPQVLQDTLHLGELKNFTKTLTNPGAIYNVDDDGQFTSMNSIGNVHHTSQLY